MSIINIPAGCKIPSMMNFDIMKWGPADRNGLIDAVSAGRVNLQDWLGEGRIRPAVAPIGQSLGDTANEGQG
jgi:hypothetical protein